MRGRLTELSTRGGERLRADPLLALLGVVAAVGLVLRLYIVWRARVVLAPAGDGYDSPTYIALGYSWRSGAALDLDHPPAWYFPPGYPLFLGVIITIRDLVGGVGGLRVWAGVVQSLLAAGAIVGIGLLGRRMPTSARAGRWLGLLGALLFAVWPGQVISAAVIMSEGLFTPLFVLAMVLLLWDHKPSGIRLGVAGVVFGYLVITRYAAIPLLPVAIAAVVFSASSVNDPFRLGSVIRRTALFVAPLTAFLAPWMVFHQYTAGSLVPAQSGAFNLCAGNHEGATGHFEPQLSDCDPSSVTASEMSGNARRWILANLDEQPRLLRVRFGDVFDHGDDHALAAYPSPARFEFPMDGAMLARVTDDWWGAACWLTVVGALLGLAFWEARFRWMMALSVVLLVGPLTTTGNPRYHDSLVPFMAICMGTVPILFAHGVKRVLGREDRTG